MSSDKTIVSCANRMVAGTNLFVLIFAGGAASMGWKLGTGRQSGREAAAVDSDNLAFDVCMMVITYALWMIFIFYYRRRIQKLTKTYLSRSFGLCRCCGYNLSDRLQDGVCPECGEQFTLQGFRRV